jgi:hypothetical protein
MRENEDALLQQTDFLSEFQEKGRDCQNKPDKQHQECVGDEVRKNAQEYS